MRKKALAGVLAVIIGIQGMCFSATGETLDFEDSIEIDLSDGSFMETGDTENIILESDEEDALSSGEEIFSLESDAVSTELEDEIRSRMEEIFTSIHSGKASRAEDDQDKGSPLAESSEYPLESAGSYIYTTNAWAGLQDKILEYGKFVSGDNMDYYRYDLTYQNGDYYYSTWYCYLPGDDELDQLVFLYMITSTDDKYMRYIEIDIPYDLSYTVPYYDATIIYYGSYNEEVMENAESSVYEADIPDWDTFASQDLDFTVYKAYSTDREVENNANGMLTNAFAEWNSDLSYYFNMTMEDLGFGRYGEGDPTIELSSYEIELCTGFIDQIFVRTAEDDYVTSWKSSKTSVAKVNSSGYITAVAPGTATITVTLNSGLTAKVKVNVVSTRLQRPTLIAAYNGAKGIGIKFYRVDGASSYLLYRKFNGVWDYICEFSATDPELQISGNTIMYTDTSVAANYGKGYIYSVAAKRGSETTSYDTKGSAIYRLTPPTLTKITNPRAGVLTVSWKGVFGRTETNGNYDLQCAEYKDGKAGTFRSITTLPGYDYQTTERTISGFRKGARYVFRIRCSKTNKDRGTYYSEYSPWLSIIVTK